MEERYIATMVLHGLGDTIGFNNSKWEFMNTNSLQDNTTEKFYEFIDYGGINCVPQKGWLISDDTIMHVAVAKALLKPYDTLEQLYNHIVDEFIVAFNFFTKNGEFEKRQIGKTLLESLRQIAKGRKWNGMEYDYYAGGSGASMRSLCIGLAYHGINNREQLIQVGIESSRITHNSTVGFLGGLVSALFTAYAIENISLDKWPFLLLELFRSNVIDDYRKSTDRDYDRYSKDVHIFIDKWTTYINGNFDDDGNHIKRRSTKNLVIRTQYYYNTFRFGDIPEQEFPGSGGDDSVIIAYDCLLDSTGNWEKLVVYSMLHGGDTDTTGCIAAGWYGAIHGLKGVPTSRIDIIENKDELYDLGKKLYKKFNNKN